MKQPKFFLLAVVAMLAPLSGWAVTTDTSDAPPPLQTTEVAPDTFAGLGRPAREVARMAKSGVPEDVVKTYIDNSTSTYNLTPDNIISLSSAGVPGTITTAMLNHDATLRANAGMLAPIPGQPQPAVQQPPMPDQPGPYPGPDQQAPPGYGYDNGQPAPDYGYDYSDLSPYGSWNYLAGYGYCWQPFGWLGSSYYPWNLLQFGRWWNCPGRGWLWFPGSRFHGSFGGVRAFGGARSFGGFQGGRSFTVGQNRVGGMSRPFVIHNTSFRSSTGFRTFSAGTFHSVGHSFGGHSMGVHMGGGGSFHR